MLRTKFQLMSALFARTAHMSIVRVKCPATQVEIVGILCDVEREDGSGNCFNLCILTNENKKVTVFWRSED